MLQINNLFLRKTLQFMASNSDHLPIIVSSVISFLITIISRNKTEKKRISLRPKAYFVIRKDYWKVRGIDLGRCACLAVLFPRVHTAVKGGVQLSVQNFTPRDSSLRTSTMLRSLPNWTRRSLSGSLNYLYGLPALTKSFLILTRRAVFIPSVHPKKPEEGFPVTRNF